MSADRKGSRLDGKTVLVTGGSRGIGAAIADACAAQGAQVVISSRKIEGLTVTADDINGRYPGSVFPRACHMGQNDAIGELCDWTRSEVGEIDVLVNNAATNPYFGPLLMTPEGAWDKTLEVNLRGYFEASRQVATRWLELERGGSIINVTSVMGMTAAPMQGIYGMSKAAVISMTKTMAMELGSVGIRVNAIAPGLVDTRFAATIVENEDLVKHFTERTGLRRYAQPHEIAGMAVYLASDESSYVTGQTLAVDGGFTTS